MTQRFGSRHTIEKLRALTYHAEAYAAIMNNQSYFKCTYIDAFAGDGQGMTNEGIRYNGSVKLALKFRPSFDRFHFIEGNKRNVSRLNTIKAEYLGHEISIHHGDANIELLKILQEIDWRHERALIFADPFGLQLNWTTVESMMENTKVDALLWFPLEGVRRQLADNPERQRPEHKKSLDRIFGNSDWEKFYQKTEDLFGDPNKLLSPNIVNEVLKLYQSRLLSISSYCSEPITMVDRFSLFLCLSNKSENAKRLASKLVTETRKQLTKLS